MENHAQNYKTNKILFESSSDAIKALEEGNVDAILIGRVAYSYETLKSPIFIEEEGYTLIFKEKLIILYEDIFDFEINTYISKETIEEKFPELKNIKYHENKEKEFNNSITLINWKDFKDDFKLLVPVDKNFNKIEKFRTPIIYKKENINIDNYKI